MQKIRTFIAIPLPEDIQGAAEDMISRMSGSMEGVKWLESETLHLTLKFLGDVDNREIPDVCKVLRKCCEPREPFSLKIQGAGAFPDLERARVVWSGIEDEDSALCPLVADIDERMGGLGFRREFRDYRPHLTLGRLSKGSRPSNEFAQAINSEKDTYLGTIQVSEVRLYASFLDREGPTYNVMDHVLLGQ